MKRLINIILIILAMLISGCSNSSQAVKNENEQLKSKVAQLEKDLNDKDLKLTELQNNGLGSLTINYIENTNSKRFVEKQCDLAALPMDNSIKLNTIKENTVVTVLDTANVNDIIWYYVSIPVYDSPSNYKGWVKESNTVTYTKDKMKSVQGDVLVKTGEDVYEGFEFSVIKSARPYKAGDGIRGRIEEKRDGYVRLSCPGGKDIWVKEGSIVYLGVD